MRTTVDIPKPLYKYAKQAAMQENVKFSDIIAESLALHKNIKKQEKGNDFVLPVWNSGGFTVDLNDKETIQNLLDREDHPEFFEHIDG